MKPNDVKCEFCEIRKEGVFHSLCSEEIKILEENKSCSNYKKGQQLFHEGVYPVGVYCINGGRFKLTKIGSEGKEQIVHIASKGDLLGYKAMLTGDAYSVGAEAIEDSSVCFISKETFLNSVTRNPSLQGGLLEAVCNELQIDRDKLTSMAQRSVRDRVASTLLMLMKTYGIDGKESEDIEINLSRTDLANMVGTADETLIRQLKEFKNEGFIKTIGRKIIVINASGLIRIAQD